MPTGVTYFMRVIIYLVRVLVILALVVALVYFVFNFATDATTCYMVVKEGLGMRAESIIEGSSQEGLNKLFTDSFLEKDSLLNSQAARSVVQPLPVYWLWNPKY